jgi:hypothetical protein
VTWRKLPQLVEVVSVEDDCLLGTLTAEEVLNIADVGTHLVCFRDLKRLQETVARVGVTAPINLLCVFRAKGAPVAPQPAFTFLGYDLIDDKTAVRAVTNCGSQFSAVIGDADVNVYELINTFERAKEIQRELRRVYPRDPHANCSLWAIFRISELGASRQRPVRSESRLRATGRFDSCRSKPPFPAGA